MTYRDEIVVYRVISQDSVAARVFLVELKESLKSEFRQEEILIIDGDRGACRARAVVREAA